MEKTEMTGDGAGSEAPGVNRRVRLRRRGLALEMVVEGAVHAWWHPDRFLHMAWTAMAAACLVGGQKVPASVAMLGVAGGTTFRILRHLLPGVRLVGVEVDPAMVVAGRSAFGLDGLGIEMHVADARDWVRRSEGRFDVVIDDCYLGGERDVYRPGGVDVTMLEGLRRLAGPDGLVVANLVTGAGHRAVQSGYRRWFRGAFRQAVSLTVPDSQNEVLVGGAVIEGKRALAGWAEHFGREADRRRWAGVAVRRLGAGRMSDHRPG